jgi:hypothetical protein
VVGVPRRLEHASARLVAHPGELEARLLREAVALLDAVRLQDARRLAGAVAAGGLHRAGRHLTEQQQEVDRPRLAGGDVVAVRLGDDDVVAGGVDGDPRLDDDGVLRPGLQVDVEPLSDAPAVQRELVQPHLVAVVLVGVLPGGGVDHQPLEGVDP